MKLLTLCLILFSSLAGAEEAQYTAEEIEGLAVKGSWSEAILHLPDVTTGDRGKNWEALVEKVAVGYLKSLNEESPSNAMTMVETLPQTYPSLRRSAKYRDTVDAIAYSGFKTCFSQKEGQPECFKRMKEHVGTMNKAERDRSRFCKDKEMGRSLAELCTPAKANAKGKRAKP